MPPFNHTCGLRAVALSGAGPIRPVRGDAIHGAGADGAALGCREAVARETAVGRLGHHVPEWRKEEVERNLTGWCETTELHLHPS